MKKLFYLLSILFTLFQFSCSKAPAIEKEEPIISAGKKIVKIKFIKDRDTRYLDSDGGITDKDFIEVEAEMVFEDSKLVLKSEKLVEIELIDSETGKKTYGYRYVESNLKIASIAPFEARMEPDLEPGVYRGLYGFNGTCFVWGTLYVGDNGESLFVAADISTQLLLNVCPPDGSLFAETDENKKI
ncbi:hypothetical protein JHJ32_17365 [Parapedobacter sp. ISTM3]|uniref:hypothetical protein n=1 Tax=Parapedobacter sp. ISTM3 TaxID=2800130 RepID=UPI001905FD77|nr:hypothetical protein [Parapedobacter sp. ISTM3]MBK1441772.1 hypothetical protein [Parapedobacter sp. ISTM3]